MTRIFLAHTYRSTDAELQGILALLEPYRKHNEEIVLGRDDNRRWIDGGAGFQQGWIESVAKHYQVIIVVPDSEMEVGRPTASIIEFSLSYGKRVVLFCQRDDGVGVKFINVLGVDPGRNGNYRKLRLEGYA
jgi:hypothetical protein